MSRRPLGTMKILLGTQDSDAHPQIRAHSGQLLPDDYNSDDASLLIKPVQRLLKYPLLLALRSPVAPYLHSPPTSVLSSCASQTPTGDIKHLSQPTLTNKDSSLPRNTYALSLVGEFTPLFL